MELRATATRNTGRTEKQKYKEKSSTMKCNRVDALKPLSAGKTLWEKDSRCEESFHGMVGG